MSFLMPQDLFTRDPRLNAVDGLRERMTLGLRPQQVAPEPEAPQPTTALEFFSQVSRETGAPTNLVWAIGEHRAAGGQLDPDSLVADAQRVAAKINEGADPRAALADLLGDEQAAESVLNLAYDIADQEFPTQEQIEADAAETARSPMVEFGLGLAKDTGAGIARGLGHVVDSAVNFVRQDELRPAMELTINENGEAVAAPVQSTATPTNAATQFMNRTIAQPLNDSAQGNYDRMGALGEEMRASGLEGDLFDPSTWAVSENATLRGLGLKGLQALGSFAPVVATAVLTRSPTATMAMGGVQGAGEAVNEAEQTVRAAAADIDENGVSRLERESDLYRALRAEGLSHEDATDRMVAQAQAYAGNVAAVIAGAGGAATQRIIAPAGERLVRGGLMQRVLGTAALSGVEEGAQEVAEGVGAKIATGRATGLDIDITDGSLESAVMGAFAGGMVGGASAIPAQRRDEGPTVGPAPSAPQDSPPAPRPAPRPQSPVAPDLGAAPVAPTPDVAPPAPMGPLETAVASAPPAPEAPVARDPLFPDLKPGQEISLQAPDGMNVDAVFLREIDTGVVVRFEGQEISLTPQEFDAARVAAGRAPEPTPAQTAPEQAPVPQQDQPLSVRARQALSRPGEAIPSQPETPARTVEDIDREIAAIRAQASPANGGMSGRLSRRLAALQRQRAEIAPSNVASDIETAAAEVETNPTDAQKEAGNYKKGHIRWQGYDISIENPRGSVRSGTSPNGKSWSVKMPDHYGYIRRTEGNDGDHVDIYMGPNPDSGSVFVIDQTNTDGTFDEHKVMLGYNSAEDARRAHEAAFSDGRGQERMGAITAMDVERFKTWLKDGDQTKPVGMRAPEPAQGDLPLDQEPAPQPEPDSEAPAEDRTPEPGREEVAPVEPEPIEGDEDAARQAGEQAARNGDDRRLPSNIDPTDDVAARAWYEGFDSATRDAIASARADSAPKKSEPATPATPAHAQAMQAALAKHTPYDVDVLTAKFQSVQNLAATPTGKRFLKKIHAVKGLDAKKRAADDFVREMMEKTPDRETGVFLDNNGEVIALLRGNKVRKDGSASITFPAYLVSEIEAKGLSYATHNHPSGKSFSEADLQVAYAGGPEFQIKAMIASGRDHIASIADDITANEAEMAEAIKDAVRRVRRFLDRVFAARQIEPNEADRALAAMPVMALAKAGVFKYEGEATTWLDDIPTQWKKEAEDAVNEAAAELASRFGRSRPVVEPGRPGGVDRAPQEPAADTGDRAPDQGAGGRPPAPGLARLTPEENAELAALEAEFSGRLRNQLNSGLDPDLVSIAFKIGRLYVKNGVRNFRAYLGMMVQRLGLPAERLEPYARNAYNQIRDDMELQGEDVADMDSATDVLAAVRAMRAEAEAPTPEPEPTAQTLDVRPPPSRRANPFEDVTDAFYSDLSAGEAFSTIVAARKRAAEVLGRDLEPEDYKPVEEAIEAAIVRVARNIVTEGNDQNEVYQDLVDLYGRQPILAERTSGSIERQAYSTPAPLAYVAARLARTNTARKVFEPSAGTGMLLIDSDPATVTANEIDLDRKRMLEDFLGPDATIFAVDAASLSPRESVDAIIMNPPFGAAFEGGQRKSWPMGTTTTKEIDHAIAWKALSSLTDDGRAVLLLGGVKKTLRGEERAKGYRTPGMMAFYKQLYDTYNVTDHFTVAGDLYRRQGAGWPVDVVVIEGRGASKRTVPMAEAPEVLQTWGDIAAKLEGREDGAGLDLVSAAERPAPDSGAADPAGTPDTGSVSQRPEPALGQDVPQGARPGAPGGRDIVDGSDPDVREPGPDGDAVPAEQRRPVRSNGNRTGEVAGPDVGVEAGPGDRVTDRGNDAAGVSGRPVSERSRVERENTEVETSFQKRYEPRSNARFAVGTLVPANMQAAIQKALDTIEAAHGDIDAFVASNLGWTVDEMLGTEDTPGYLSAEQVDAAAMAMFNAEQGKGFIVGDQTGVGKGRFVAAMLKYAERQGHVPVFVTQQPNLYADMVRDLRDIGEADVLDQVVITNGDLTGKKGVPVDREGKEVIQSLPKAKLDKMLRDLSATGKLPEGKRFLFTTYDQMTTTKGLWPLRANALLNAASGLFVVLDESHVAGGTEQGAWGKKRGAGEPPRNRAEFFRDLTKAAAGSMFSSATYAKNPAVMSLYGTTDLALAVDNIEDLSGAISAGGVPLQQVIANQLVEAGQFARRERSYDGVEMAPLTVEVERKKVETLSKALADMFDFDEVFMGQVREKAAKDIAKEGEVILPDGSVGTPSITSTNFASSLHNLVTQMLFSLKVEGVANRAIEQFRAGKKPLIALTNTNEGILNEQIDAQGADVGDVVEVSFKVLLRRYLERLREITVKDYNGETRRIRLSDEKLGATALGQYRKMMDMIEALDIDDMSGNPLDAIMDRMRAAGIRVGEITGRGRVLVNGEVTARDNSQAAKKRTMQQFNAGDLDAVLINRSGSTGFSMHATGAADNDGKPRHMIVMQPDPNIDVFMQMLGRIHRTGQTELPSYDIVFSDIAIEKRPAAILMRKMASLNANTTAAKGGSVSVGADVVDFLNAVGDKVVAEYLGENPEIAVRLNITGSDDGPGKGPNADGLAQRVTGRMVVLPPSMAEDIYSDLEQRYLDRVAELDRMGQNPLEAKTLDLQARTLGRSVLRPAKGSGSPLDAETVANIMSVRKLGKPMTYDQAMAEADKALAGRTTREIMDEISKAFQDRAEAHMKPFADRVATRKADLAAVLADEKATDKKKADAKAAVAKAQTALEQELKRIQEARRMAAQGLVIGASYRMESPTLTTDVIVLGLDTSKMDANRIVPSKVRVRLAVADATRDITLPLTRFVGLTSDVTMTSTAKQQAMIAFDSGQSESREQRTIITGNMIDGFAQFSAGQVVMFTDDKGDVKPGILMPKTFDLGAALDSKPVPFAKASDAIQFLFNTSQAVVDSSDGVVRITKRGQGYVFTVKKKNGKPYYLNQTVRDILGDFRGRGSASMEGMAPDSLTATRAAQAMIDQVGAEFQADNHKDAARAITGQELPKLVVKPGATLEEGIDAYSPGRVPASEAKLKLAQAAEQWVRINDYQSPLLAALEGAKQAKAPAQDWKAIISKLPGVKKAEIEWLGVYEWLDFQGGQVTREDLVAFVRQEQVEIVEHIGADMLEDAVQAQIIDGDAIKPSDEYVTEEAEQYLDEAREEIADEEGIDPSEVDDAEVLDRAKEKALEYLDRDPAEYEATLVINGPQGEIRIDGSYNSLDEEYWFSGTIDGKDISFQGPHDDVVEDAENWTKDQAAGDGLDADFKSGFETYTEDGGSNYREILLTVPDLEVKGRNSTIQIQDRDEKLALIKEMQALQDEHGNEVRWKAGHPGNARWSAIAARLREMTGDRQEKGSFVESAHFQTENVVVHARVKDRRDRDGKSVLFVEEIQSDLATKWREATEPAEVTARRRKLQEERSQNTQANNETLRRIADRAKKLPGWKPEWEDHIVAYSAIREAIGIARGDSDIPRASTPVRDANIPNIMAGPDWAVERDEVAEQLRRDYEIDRELIALGTEKSVDPELPDTPFKEELTYGLMVRRLLREAVQRGYDKLSWTPGYMQARRWDAAAQSVVDDVDWKPWNDEPDTTAREVKLTMERGGNVLDLMVGPDGVVDAVYIGERMAKGHILEGKHLRAIVGPKMATEIMEKPAGTLSGQRITFPDSGYAIAYDQQTKKAVEKVVKRYGGRAYQDKTLSDFGAQPFDVAAAKADIPTDVALAHLKETRPQAHDEVLRMTEEARRTYVERFGETEDIDQLYKNTLRKYVMQTLGADAVRALAPEQPGNGMPVWSVDITDEMKELGSSSIAMFAEQGDVFSNLKAGTSHWIGDIKALARNAVTDAMSDRSGSLLSLVPGRALFAELGRNLPGAQTYLRLKEEMDALRQDWQARVADTTDRWIGFARKHKDANERLMDLMHRATLAGIDPSKPFGSDGRYAQAREEISRSPKDSGIYKWAEEVLAEEAAQRATYERLKAEFDALPAELQAMFGEVAKTYSDMATEFEDAVLSNIQKAAKIALKRAERNHAREIRKITDDGLEGAAREEAIAAADKRLARAKAGAGWALQAKLASLRTKFESNRLKGPYFPLARFGQYFVTVRDSNGQVISFSRFEKASDQAKEIEEARKEGGVTVEHGVLGAADTDLKSQVDPDFVADIQSLLGDYDADPRLMDAIWQRWLETLPDQSVRTNRIHRKGRRGFNRDAIRAFTHHTFHGSHQLARLKYGLDMQEALDQAEDQAKQTRQPERSGLVVNEMRKRHAFTMEPTGGRLATALTSTAFVWYLGMTPAAAAVNISQTTVVAPAILGARFRDQGAVGAAKQIAKAGRDFLDGRFDAAKGSRVTEQERAAIEEAYRRGTVDKTQAHELASVAETGVEYNSARERVMRVVSAMFHHAERANREVTFLAAYRMARADGLPHQAAIDEGANLTWKSHFDYQNTARPRIMQNDTMKVLTIFRQFTVNMLWRMGRDLSVMMTSDDPDLRREARGQFVGITLSMLGHAGIRGVWGYGIIKMIFAALVPGDDDDLDVFLQKALLIEGDSPAAAAWNYGMGMALNGVPGHMTGVALSERIGMPNLWFRESNRPLEGEEWYAHMVSEMLGPVYGIGEGIARGVRYAADGDLYRGIETAIPKALRDAMKAGRYAYEGVETRSGEDLIENVRLRQVLTQLMGFTPAQIAERYDANSRMKNREQEIVQRRSGIQREVGDAILAGRPIPQRVMDKVMEFNREFPEYPITNATIRQSVASRQRASDRNEFGIQINPRLNDRIRGEEPDLIYN